jgi:predicted NUDIX family phosphoesterase
MRSILVLARTNLFPGLSPQGFLHTDSIDLETLQTEMFFAERDYMEQCSHFKQIIPYLVLHRGSGDDTRVLCYQRKIKHTETRLGGLWSVGFGGHIEPVDREDPATLEHGLLRASALRELVEETGLTVSGNGLKLSGFINSDSNDVSSVHFGAVYTISLDELTDDDEAILATVSEQAEPHQSRWIKVSELAKMTNEGDGPDGGSFEDWSNIAIDGIY